VFSLPGWFVMVLASLANGEWGGDFYLKNRKHD
jgi:hypothetical protein